MEYEQIVFEQWNLLGMFLISNAMFFAACAFLIWVGFRLSNNIYNASETPAAGKVMASIFCLSVAMMTFGNMAWLSGLFKTTGSTFAAMQEQGVQIGAVAEELIANTSEAPFIGATQIAFLSSIVIMQMAQIWMKKD